MGATTRQPRRNLYDACRDCEHSIPSYGRCRAGYGKIKEDCQGQVNGLTPTLDSLLLFCKGREQGMLFQYILLNFFIGCFTFRCGYIHFIKRYFHRKMLC